MKERIGCPICNSTETSFFCNLDEEYLITSDSGWKHDKELMKLSGFDTNKNIECSYYRCSDCKAYYIKHIYDMEIGFQAFYKKYPKTYEEGFINRNKNRTKSFVRRAKSIMNALDLAIERSKSQEINVLDYGCGGAFDLSIMRAVQTKKAVGYNPYSYPFDVAKKYIQSDIFLLDDIDDVKKHGPYDFIRCNGVLEHVNDPIDSLKKIYSLLSENGVVYFSAPNSSDALMAKFKKQVLQKEKVKILHPGHLQIWNLNGMCLSRFVQKNGFKVIPFRSRPKFNDITEIKNVTKLMSNLILLIVITFYDYYMSLTGHFKRSDFVAIKNKTK